MPPTSCPAPPPAPMPSGAAPPPMTICSRKGKFVAITAWKASPSRCTVIVARPRIGMLTLAVNLLQGDVVEEDLAVADHEVDPLRRVVDRDFDPLRHGDEDVLDLRAADGDAAA